LQRNISTYDAKSELVKSR